MESCPEKKLIVYLAELAHDGFGLSLRTFPLGLGVVGSYIKAKFGEAIELHLFRTYGDLFSAVNDRKPDIVGFGYFSWNDYLTLVAARAIRKECPDALIVFGGSNISPYGQERTSGFPIAVKHAKDDFPVAAFPTRHLHEYVWPVYDDYQLLTNYPNIDVIIHGDGEIPMADLVAQYMKLRDRDAVKRSKVQGCSALVGKQIMRGPAPEILYDLDKIPSPYTTGLFREFMDKYNLLPQIETIRGCPYKCTFCTVGLNEGKLRKHSFEYTKSEILYLKENYPNTVLRIADPNWGIAKKDVELAQFLHDLRKDTGYPSSLRVYYSAGGPFENLKKMAVLMKNLLPLNMSFQSLNTETLKEIKRGNMSMNKVREMVAYARENEIATSTELISGLPKESVESFKQSFLTAVEMRLDSVYMGALYLIKGSELFTAEDRQRYKFRTNFALIGKDVTRVDGRWVFEMDEVVVEHAEMSHDDFFELYRFKIWGMISYAAAYLKEILMHCLTNGVSPLEIYDELVANPDGYPFHSAVLTQYVESLRPLFFETAQDLEEKLGEHIEKFGNVDQFYWTRYTQVTMAKVLGCDSKVIFVNEVVKAAKSIYDKKHQSSTNAVEAATFHELLEELRRVQPECIISPLEKNQRVVTVSLPVDIKAWANDNYNQPLSRYRMTSPREFALVIRNIQEHDRFLEATKDIPTEAQKYDYYYTVMVSSNMRRRIAYAENEALTDDGLPTAENPMDNG